MAGNDEYTVLLIHSDHSDGSTDITDSSVAGNGGNQHSITVGGDTHHETDQKYFGASSIYFDGDGDRLTIPDHNDWNFANGDFTIDLWLRLAALPSLNTGAGLWDQYYNTDNRVHLYLLRSSEDERNITFMAKNGGTLICSMTADVSWAVGTWYHVAIVRHGNDFSLYWQGSSVDTDTNAGTMPDVNTGIIIGRYINDTHQLNGYMDEFRISKGIARWTENFTPPSEPYSEEEAGIVFPIFAQEGHHSLVFGGQVIH